MTGPIFIDLYRANILGSPNTTLQMEVVIDDAIICTS
jgi:hypothetical protein